MSNDKRIRDIQNDIHAIKVQIEALVCETRLSKLNTLSFLLELAYKEVSGSSELDKQVPNVRDTPLTLQ